MQKASESQHEVNILQTTLGSHREGYSLPQFDLLLLEQSSLGEPRRGTRMGRIVNPFTVKRLCIGENGEHQVSLRCRRTGEVVRKPRENTKKNEE